MKINKIITFFSLSVILAAVLRFFQIKYTIEFATGFFIGNFAGFGYFMLIAIFLAALLCGIFAFTYYKNPERPPVKSVLLGVVSFIPAITVVLENLVGNSQFAVNPFQNILLKFASVLTAIFFCLFGIGRIIDFKMPDWITLMPSIYFIIKMIVDFAKISSLAIISDYILSIATYCVILLFFIAFAKLYNCINDEKNFKKLFAYGLSAALLSLSQSVAYFVINLIFENQYNHIGITTNLNFIAFGLFIVAFVFVYFGCENKE